MTEIERPYRIYTTTHDVVTDARSLIGEGRDPAEVLEGIRRKMREATGEVPAPTHDVRGSLVAFVVALGRSAVGDTIQRELAAVIRQTEALEAAGASVAILGYTTTSWKGGLSRREWVATGQNRVEGAPRPGRLCDLLHVVLKTADVPVADAMEEIAVGAHERVMKENVDGEGLEWAYETVLGTGFDRIAMVHVVDKLIAVDDSTIGANDFEFLQDHSRAVVSRIAAEGRASIAVAVVSSWDRSKQGLETGHYQGAALSVEYSELDAVQEAVSLAVDHALSAMPAPAPRDAPSPGAP